MMTLLLLVICEVECPILDTMVTTPGHISPYCCIKTFLVDRTTVAMATTIRFMKNKFVTGRVDASKDPDWLCDGGLSSVTVSLSVSKSCHPVMSRCWQLSQTVPR